jgi:RNA polymerase sigma factor
LTILNIFNKSQRNSEPLGDTIKKIKNGDDQLREKLINDYKPYIIKVVSKTTGMYVDLENSEEFSIGLIAFNEAIDCFDANKYSGFLSFAQTVIKRRLIDYIRKNEKNRKVFPLTYFYNDENEVDSSFEDKYLIVDSSSQFSNVETKEEIALFLKKLNYFGIELNDLVKSAPKHMDSKRLSIRIARVLVENKELSEKLERKRNIPMIDLMKLVAVNHKTIERNRKFIIAVYLVLMSNLEVMQGYVENIEKGGKKDE